MKKRKSIARRRPGDFLKIELGDGTHAYARVLDSTVAFYGTRTTEDLSVEAISRLSIIFNVWVMDHPILEGDWPIIGHLLLPGDLNKEVLFFKKDPISRRLTIYRDSTGEEFPATTEQCEKLECAAVWSPEHIVDRLVDFFENRPNKWYVSMRP
ncbi:MAG: immunity 26/phosphotriesterase HocA family protein [Nitrospiraceae bacterium]|nr:immunity 26/phosphotriesterase HocA family protein [Nitrospiraceae bacterium]